jgi:hypothetical protein
MMNTTLQLIINIGAVAVALSGVIGLPIAIVKLWPLIKRFVKIGAVMEMLPETLSQQNEVMAGMASDVKKAVKQVQNSHVTNLRDDLDDVKAQVASIHDKLDSLTGQTTSPTTTININPEATP